jgi:hypothetical protein
MVRVSLENESPAKRRPENRTPKPSRRHVCEKRTARRLLCSDLVRVSWMETDGRRRDEVAILENLSLSGVGLFTGVPVPEDCPVEISGNDARLNGLVRRCGFRENGYVIGIELDENSKWAQEPNSGFLPEHLLDVSLLDLE